MNNKWHITGGFSNIGWKPLRHYTSLTAFSGNAYIICEQKSSARDDRWWSAMHTWNIRSDNLFRRLRTDFIGAQWNLIWLHAIVTEHRSWHADGSREPLKTFAYNPRHISRREINWVERSSTVGVCCRRWLPGLRNATDRQRHISRPFGRVPVSERMGFRDNVLIIARPMMWQWTRELGVLQTFLGCDSQHLSAQLLGRPSSALVSHGLVSAHEVKYKCW